MNAQIALAVVVIVITLVIALVFVDKSRKRELGIIDAIVMGRYVAGYPGTPEKKESVECAVNEHAYTLLTGSSSELGRIPRDGVLDIFYDEKRKLLPRLTSTKDLSFESFNLDRSRKLQGKEYCLVIDWDDNFGLRHNTVFEFTGMSAATLAHKCEQALKRHQKPHIPRLRSDEKKCPVCAEIIKREALLCRYCNSRI